MRHVGLLIPSDLYPLPLDDENSMKHSVLTALVALSTCSSAAFSQEQPVKSLKESGGAIAWYGTWESGLKAAKTSGRPILLVSAAPHCHGISGIW